MVKVSFKLNGRTLAPNRITDELTKQVEKSAQSMAKQRIESIRCPVHHQRARLVPTGPRGQYRVEGCCDELIERVQGML